MTLPLAKTIPTDAKTSQNTIVGFDTNQGGKQVYVSSGYTPGISATPVKPPVTTNNAADKAASDKVAGWQKAADAAAKVAQPPVTQPVTPPVVGQGLTDVQKKLTTPQDPTSQKDAYAQLTTQAQDSISAIENYYNQLMAQNERAGGIRESQSNAMALAAGMAGSGTAMASLEKEKGVTAAEKSRLTSEMTQKIADVYDNVQKNSMTLAQMGQEELTTAETTRKNIKAEAMSSLDVFAENGNSANQIKEQAPQLYQNLSEQLGWSDYQIASYIDSRPNNPNKPSIQIVDMPNPADGGKTTIRKRISFNPTTGKSSIVEGQIDLPYLDLQGKQIIQGSDGTTLMLQPDGVSYKNITPGIIGDKTTSQKDYEYYAKQETEAGRKVLSFDQWQANAKAPAAYKEYLAAKADGFKGDIVAYQQAKKGAGTTLDADTINFLAEQYVSTPGTQIPSFGQGAAGMASRAQFYTAVAQAAEAKGLDGKALAARKASATAAQSALTKMTTLTAATKAAEKAAISNLDLAYKYGEKYDRTGYPVANRFTNWLNGQVGDAQLSAFETALYTGAREYAKVSSGAAGSVAGLTDSATKEAERLVNAAMTQGQLKSTLEAMKMDMKNVEESQQSTLQGLKDQIETGTNTDSSPSNNNASGGSSGASSSGSTMDWTALDTASFDNFGK